MARSVFYAESYHPIQAGSIDGTDVLPHDSAVFRAHLCSSAALYDPFGDPNAVGDPSRTLFVGRLSRLTTQHSLTKAMSKYGRVTTSRLVTDIVTGASRGYAFVEFETERDMQRAYKDAHHAIIDDFEIIVDYNRQHLMPGWIPRRLGGGLGGKKESGQLRFGGRERPFRAPLLPIPYDELKKLGIPPPPEGRYMSPYQDPSPPRPRRDRSIEDREEEVSYRNMSPDQERDPRHTKRSSKHREEQSCRISAERGKDYIERTSLDSAVRPPERFHKRPTSKDDEVGYKHRDEACTKLAISTGMKLVLTNDINPDGITGLGALARQ